MKRLTASRTVTDDGLDLEIEGAVRVVTGSDARTGLEAFVARKQPVFSTQRLDS
jgi:hypothetical protein